MTAGLHVGVVIVAWLGLAIIVAPDGRATPPSQAAQACAEASTVESGPRDLAFPLPEAYREHLTSTFYELRGDRPHEALDIPAPRHTPVRAVDAGTIAKLFSSAAGGLTIYQFDTSKCYVFYYAHLESYAAGLAEDQHVQRGQVIGEVGTSGNAPAQSPHLHFAIFSLSGSKQWWEGTPIDPYPILK